MAYKFQRGGAILSGSLIQEGAIQGESLDAGLGGITNAGAISGATTISGSGALAAGSIAMAEFTVDSSGNTDIDGTLNVEGVPTFQAAAVFSGGITTANAIAGATSIDGSGDLTMGTITMTGFSVDADGDLVAKSIVIPDDATIGAVGDTDMITLDAGNDVTFANNLDIVIGKAGGLNLADGAVTSTAAELNLVDGSGAGSIVASKAVIYDALGAVNANALSGTLEYMLDVAADGGLGMTPFNNAANVADLKISASYFAAGAVAVAADSFMFFDADGSVKKESLADYATAIAGSGLAATNGVLSVDLNQAAAGVVNLANDSFTFIDADDSNAVKKDSYADYAALAAGVGLSAASGVFAFDASELSDAAVASGDKFVFEDATDNSSKKENIDDIATLFAGVGLSAASAVMALDLNELSAVAIASGDFVAIVDSTDNSTKKESIDDIATLFAGNGLSAASAVMALDLNELSAAAVNVAADSIAIVDADDSNNSKKESIADLATAMAGAGLTATAGVFSVQGNSVAALADGGTAAEGYNYIAADATSAITVSLPAAPSVGDVVTIKAKGLSGAGKVVINRQGSHTIDGETQVTIESTYGAISFVYVLLNDWRII